MASVFFSYSHKDEPLRDELEIHLAMLKRQGVIDAWHDRRIGAGEVIDQTISENLENADITLLLVSPDFLASDYCYDVEMTRALERHEEGNAKVIPVILRPCDWHSARFGKLLATPTDGKPVTKFPDKDEAFLEIVKAIKRAAEQVISAPIKPQTGLSAYPPTEQTAPVRHALRSSNLRIRKSFTDHDRDTFLDDAFDYMANFFEGSLAELERRNPSIRTRFRRIDARHFSAAIYENGKSISSCRIWQGSQNSFTSGLVYAYGDTGSDSSFNEQLRIEDDGHMMYLKPLGMQFHQPAAKEKLTNEGASEYYWNLLIHPLQE
ncbi:TIR (plasmid) [Nitrosococcus oceani ATCC 19707]|uniref:TIR n=3 Tax=Nitrosococcus oceani TaxID=1229 RepID=Q3JF60_NITOC|nr:toll/interleukin-1 receptor domain-containing protein [Nitrosococcus oceani]ABA56536.1 TIR [Nitrosococcus oceani ATCC 19707]EDZ65221.1 hypothetical protein NOC27_3385 [Nitrosococcus oceani AFC27]KFI17757.1 hypothetical protein IB75_18525 [Nitrosococcus oceani C-27]BBM60812.1 hypothetical protein NONS58_P0260 [Nitrosococcus oceani]